MIATIDCQKGNLTLMVEVRNFEQREILKNCDTQGELRTISSLREVLNRA